MSITPKKAFSHTEQRAKLFDHALFICTTALLVGALLLIALVAISFVILIIAVMWWGILSIGGLLFP